MKTLKFTTPLVEKILSGEKRSTWRIFDEKDLKAGDKVVFIEKETGKEFAQAVIVMLKIKTLGTLTEEDWIGHEKFPSNEAMYVWYRKFYNNTVNEHTEVKILKFDILRR